MAPWADLLFQSFEIVHPLFEGDEREVREAHEEALRHCDGVLLFYGAGNEAWLRRKLTEVQKSPGTRAHQGAAALVRGAGPAAHASQGTVPHPLLPRRPPVGRMRPHAAAAVHGRACRPGAASRRREQRSRSEPVSRPSPLRGRGGPPLLRPRDTGRRAAAAASLQPLPRRRRHVGLRQVVAHPLRADPVAPRRADGEGRLELADRHHASRR